MKWLKAIGKGIQRFMRLVFGIETMQSEQWYQRAESLKQVVLDKENEVKQLKAKMSFDENATIATKLHVYMNEVRKGLHPYEDVAKAMHEIHGHVGILEQYLKDNKPKSAKLVDLDRSRFHKDYSFPTSKKGIGRTSI